MHRQVSFSLVSQAGIAFFVALIMAVRGYQRKSLSVSGAIAALVVGTLSLGALDTFGMDLILFYASSTLVTKWGKHKKEKFEEDRVVKSARGASQVLACSVLSTILALVFFYLWYFSTADDVQAHYWAALLSAAYIGHFATCTGDTWASEIGILSNNDPFLITQCKRVPRGTNGGVSALGMFASAAGGLFISVIHLLCSVGLGEDFLGVFRHGSFNLEIIAWVLGMGLLGGLGGSILDSLLGATIQVTVYDPNKKWIADSTHARDRGLVVISGKDLLSNEMVNALSATMMAALCAGVWAAFGPSIHPPVPLT